MTVLRIQEVYDVDSGTSPASSTYCISNAASGRYLTQALPVSVSAAKGEELRWYLEDYAEKDPFLTSRANAAAAFLLDYGSNLVCAIGWEAVLSPSELQQPLNILVEESAKCRDIHVFWELLERRDLWRPSLLPPRVAVLRTVSVLQPPPIIPASVTFTGTSNILILVARPAAAQDIPHRLVSQIILDTAPGGIRADIICPGTFEAFETHLQNKPKGYYNLVHFDLHGFEDSSGRVHMVFIKSVEEHRYSVFEPDYVSAARVGEVLNACSVGKVVLNACRSARGTSPETNIAAALVSGGISTVVAMSFNIVTRSVEIFVATFYKALLRHDLPFETAVFMARQAMHCSPARISKFGDLIDVHDSIVPVIYTTASGEHGDIDDLGPFPELLDGINFEPRFPFGREDAILHLESALLVGQRPVLLIGQAGVGKTCLLRHLQGWWKRIGLIEDAIHLSFAGDVGVDATSLYRRLSRYFLATAVYSGPEKLVNFLRNHRCLVVLDSLESAAVSMGTTIHKERMALLSFLKTMRGGRSLIIIASRSQENWLVGQTITHRLEGLRIIPAFQHINRIISAHRTLLIIPTWDNEEDRQYFEQIAKIVDGNPLAITTLVSDFLCKRQSPKDYYFGMLAGAPIVVNRMEYRTNEGHRSLAELNSLIDDLHLELKKVGDGFTPLALAPFWKTIPINEFHTYVALHSMVVFKLLGASLKERATSFRDFMKGLEPAVESTDIFRHMMDGLGGAEREDGEGIDLTSFISLVPGIELPASHPVTPLIEHGCRRIIQPLSAAGFLAQMDKSSVPADLKAKGYMAINPLLPIMLRAEPMYAMNYLNLPNTYRKALTLFYIWRTKEWPTHRMYYHDEWIRPRNELDIEFTNWASAVEIGLGLPVGPGDSVQENAWRVGVAKLVLVIHRGTLKDPSRFRIITVLWDKALLVLLKEMEETRAKSHTSSGSWFDLGQLFGSPVQADSDISLDIITKPVLQILAAFLALNLASYHHTHKSGGHQPYVTIASDILGDMKKAAPPEGIFHEQYRLMVSVLEQRLRMTHSHITHADVDNYGLKARDDLLRSCIDLINLNGHQEAHPDPTESWHDLPILLNSGSAMVAHMMKPAAEIRAAIDANDFGTARRLVDQTLLTELNQASKDTWNIAYLRRFLHEVDEKERRKQAMAEATDAEGSTFN